MFDLVNMGVHGLWKLVEPAGNDAGWNTLENQRIAVDASVWMYQFVKAIRTENGDVDDAGYILGFFNRVIKLIEANVFPVLVFDGPPPERKKRVLIERATKRQQATNERWVYGWSADEIRRACRSISLEDILSKKVMKQLQKEQETDTHKEEVGDASSSSVSAVKKLHPHAERICKNDASTQKDNASKNKKAQRDDRSSSGGRHEAIASGSPSGTAFSKSAKKSADGLVLTFPDSVTPPTSGGRRGKETVNFPLAAASIRVQQTTLLSNENDSNEDNEILASGCRPANKDQQNENMTMKREENERLFTGGMDSMSMPEDVIHATENVSSSTSIDDSSDAENLQNTWELVSQGDSKIFEYIDPQTLDVTKIEIPLVDLGNLHEMNLAKKIQVVSSCLRKMKDAQQTRRAEMGRGSLMAKNVDVWMREVDERMRRMLHLREQLNELKEQQKSDDDKLIDLSDSDAERSVEEKSSEVAFQTADVPRTAKENIWDFDRINAQLKKQYERHYYLYNPFFREPTQGSKSVRSVPLDDWLDTHFLAKDKEQHATRQQDAHKNIVIGLDPHDAMRAIFSECIAGGGIAQKDAPASSVSLSSGKRRHCKIPDIESENRTSDVKRPQEASDSCSASVDENSLSSSGVRAQHIKKPALNDRTIAASGGLSSGLYGPSIISVNDVSDASSGDEDESSDHHEQDIDWNLVTTHPRLDKNSELQSTIEHNPPPHGYGSIFRGRRRAP